MLFTTDFDNTYLSDGGNSGIANIPNINIRCGDIKKIYTNDINEENHWLKLLIKLQSNNCIYNKRIIQEYKDVLNVLRTIYYDNLLLNVGIITDALEFIRLCELGYNRYEGKYLQPSISINNNPILYKYEPSYTKEYRFTFETEQLISKLQHLPASYD